MLDIGLVHFLLVGAVMFAIGIAIVITKRNGVAVLMGLEVVIAASSINFIAFSRYSVGSVKGHVVAIFIIMLAAAEAADGAAPPPRPADARIVVSGENATARAGAPCPPSKSPRGTSRALMTLT